MTFADDLHVARQVDIVETLNFYTENGETVSDMKNTSKWGRVDDTNTVFVIEESGERAVGQFPDATKEEALAYFTRKFDDLEGQVRLAEQRIITGAAGSDVVSTVSKLSEALVSPLAVGDIQALRARVTHLEEKATKFAEEQKEQREKQRQEALEAREALVKEAEAIAAQVDGSIRWKDSGEKMEELFKNWQSAQKQGPKIAKAQADELWKRFKNARNTFDSARRKFFAQMDAENKTVKHKKEQLITRAEALASKGVDAISEYRSLLDEWKKSGRASRKLDDQLWARFKAAGDVLYEAKAVEIAKSDEEYQANFAVKKELLENAAPILEINDHVAARKELGNFLKKWDEVGRVPRSEIKNIEDQLRKIENHVKKLENDHWQATNPETIARSEGLKGQLEDSIASLESDLENAKNAKNDKLVKDLTAQLETQKSWLAAIS